MRKGIWPASLAFAILASGAEAQQDREKRAWNSVAPSVVGIQNDEGWGTGMILDEKGLILTNAHVMTSPLPCSVYVDSVRNDIAGPLRIGGIEQARNEGARP